MSDKALIVLGFGTPAILALCGAGWFFWLFIGDGNYVMAALSATMMLCLSAISALRGLMWLEMGKK